MARRISSVAHDLGLPALWWVLADAEGNEACVATWIGTDGLGYP